LGFLLGVFWGCFGSLLKEISLLKKKRLLYTLASLYLLSLTQRKWKEKLEDWWQFSIPK
jgi:hypothetical protein